MQSNQAVIQGIISGVILFLLALPTAAQLPYGITYNVPLREPGDKTNYEVFFISPDGGPNVNVTRHPAVDWAYNHYGKNLYMISDRDTCYRCYFLYKTDTKGGTITKVSDLQLEDSWMDFRNDGQEIIVTGRIGNAVRHQLFIINTLNGTYTQITNDTTARYGDPAFSPDGRQIAVSYKANKRDRETHEELWLLDENGKHLHQLTHYPQDDISRDQPGYKAGCAHWYPDGSFISYISFQGGRSGIFGVTPDGKQQWRLTPESHDAGWHDWSPDGEWLVFDGQQSPEVKYHLYLMNGHTNEIKQITDDIARHHQSPSFITH